MLDTIVSVSAAELAAIYGSVLAKLHDVGQASAHPLGFTVLMQVPDGQGGYARLHVWRRHPTMEQVPHSHSSHLRSTVLAGQLRNTMWSVSKPTSDGIPLVSVSKDEDCVRRYKEAGHTQIRIRSVQDFGPGESYVVPEGEFHSNECLSEMCVTMVHRQSSSGMLSRIATTLERIGPVTRKRYDLSREELTKIEAILVAEARRLSTGPGPGPIRV
jgi:hypothetical protein